MAQRQGTFRVESAAVQGEGAFVVLRRLKYGVISAAGRKVSAGNVTAEENDTFIRDLLKQGIVEWNWVDDEGKALPVPPDPDDLLATEVNFLVEQITNLNPKN